MFGIVANSFMKATWQHDRVTDARQRRNAPPSWLDEDLPFRTHAGRWTGRDD